MSVNAMQQTKLLRSAWPAGAAAVLLVLFGAGLARGATVEYQFFPDQEKPTAQGWSENKDNNDEVNIVTDEHLELVNGDANGNSGPYFIRDSTLPGSEDDWEARMRFRIAEHTTVSGETRNNEDWVAGMQVGDTNDSLVGFRAGLRDTDSDDVRDDQTLVQLRGSGTTLATPSGRPWLDVVISKTTGTNSSSTSDDTVTAKVFDLDGNELGSGSASVNDADFANAQRVLFGSLFSNAAGTVEVTGMTVGINEPAPAINIIPEPATAGTLGLLGVALLGGRRRRR